MLLNEPISLIESLLPEILDTEGTYELIGINFAEEVYPERIYLKMINPSVNDIHIEAVHPDCKTVKEALMWRNFGTVDIGFTAPIRLT